MLDATTETAGPPKEKASTDRSSGVPVQEAQEAIRKAFPYDGELRVRHLWSTDGLSRFRANWFRGQDGQMTIAKSLFLCSTRTPSGLVFQDATAAVVR